MKLLEGVIGSEIEGKDWVVWSMSITVKTRGIWVLCIQGLFPTSCLSRSLVPVVSEPGPREDTGLCKARGWFISIKLMALLWVYWSTLTWPMGTVFLKRLHYSLCFAFGAGVYGRKTLLGFFTLFSQWGDYCLHVFIPAACLPQLLKSPCCWDPTHFSRSLLMLG